MELIFEPYYQITWSSASMHGNIYRFKEENFIDRNPAAYSIMQSTQSPRFMMMAATLCQITNAVENDDPELLYIQQQMAATGQILKMEHIIHMKMPSRVL